MVKIKKLDYEIISIDLGNDKNRFNTTTVAQLREMIYANYPDLKSQFSDMCFLYGDFILNEQKYLAFYNINDDSVINCQKGFNPNKKYGLKFVKKADAITGENDNQIRAQLSCGHAVDPNSLTAWCRSLIDDGKFEFFCPAITDDAKHTQCKKPWKYEEVRKVALLNQTEIDYFEKKLSENAANVLLEFKECPKCKTFVERLDSKNLRVKCIICGVTSKKTFEFCWQCEREWTVSVSTAHDTCGRDGCQNDELKSLLECHKIKLAAVIGLPEIPSIRACPTCGKCLEHKGDNCKNIICNRCNVEFCFACLKTKAECQRLKPGSHYSTCASPVAERQTRIPLWNRGAN